MDDARALEAFAALSQETRLRLVRLLVAAAPDGLAAGVLADAVASSASNVSFHLTQLERAELVRSRRESRSIIYSARLDRLGDLAAFLLRDCCGGNPDLCAEADEMAAPSSLPRRRPPMEDRVFNVLFLCSSNSARSILAEGILRAEGGGRFSAFSAGNKPRGIVNPLALKVLESFGYPTEGYRSKSWEEFAAPDSPEMDFVFTVCDAAAGEICPSWPGHPITAHWGIEDPAAVTGSEIAREAAFVQAAKYLRNRIGAFVNLPIASLDRAALVQKLVSIGALEGTSSAEALAPSGAAE
jgi:protein-tyrosine-phosphatase/DNA-binding transcriptional ArsR family regulator